MHFIYILLILYNKKIKRQMKIFTDFIIKIIIA